MPRSLWQVGRSARCVRGRPGCIRHSRPPRRSGCCTGTLPAYWDGAEVCWPLLCWLGRHRRLIIRQHLLGRALAGSVVRAWAGAVIVDVGCSTFIHTVGREGLARIVPQNYGPPYLWREVPLHPLRILAITLPW